MDEGKIMLLNKAHREGFARFYDSIAAAALGGAAVLFYPTHLWGDEVKLLLSISALLILFSYKLREKIDD